MNQTNAMSRPSKAAEIDVLVRRATSDDVTALARLAALDSRRPLTGDCLVAEVGGVLWAARSLTTDEVVADPFRPTADLVALLHERARHLLRPDTAPRRGTLLRMAGALRPRGHGLRSG
jgi:hypothetical protein